ncbi:MAG: hypothetical protein WBL40_01010 [Terrimicrobiaceae bacterium]
MKIRKTLQISSESWSVVPEAKGSIPFPFYLIQRMREMNCCKPCHPRHDPVLSSLTHSREHLSTHEIDALQPQAQTTPSAAARFAQQPGHHLRPTLQYRERPLNLLAKRLAASARSFTSKPFHLSSE